MKASNQHTFPALALNWLLRGFCRLLYNQFAWTYDWVAWVVSLGLWKDWILTVIPFLQGDPILEVGHGTGHLQIALLELGKEFFGLDLSSSMGKITSKRLRQANKHPMLIRGTVGSIPFQMSFAHRATFPSEYIAIQRTLGESGGSMWMGVW
jgi:ubiquinone/menaquinone biosynthesis C-methylase UbiE